MTDIKILLPQCSPDEVSDLLRRLTEKIIIKEQKKRVIGFLGGEFGYGCDYENENFRMHPYCWCEQEDCKWCSGANPNYLHKSSGAKIWWYKYIGRSMEIKIPEDFDLISAIRESINSV